MIPCLLLGTVVKCWLLPSSAHQICPTIMFLDKMIMILSIHTYSCPKFLEFVRFWRRALWRYFSPKKKLRPILTNWICSCFCLSWRVEQNSPNNYSDSNNPHNSRNANNSNSSKILITLIALIILITIISLIILITLITLIRLLSLRVEHMNCAI